MIPTSLTPRRFASAISTTHASERPSSCPASGVNADVSASTPAATETATVNT